MGIPENRIYYFVEDNWWSPGENGPCGPDTEIFYDLTGSLGDMTQEEYVAADKRQDIVEIGNNVFMEYEKKNGKVIGQLKQKNVDFGGGLERQVMAVQNKRNIFDTDLFEPIIQAIKKNTNSEDIKGIRIVADHIRSAVFLITDGIVPSNTDRGYILRRLIRRAKYYYDSIGGCDKALAELAHHVVQIYKETDYSLEKEMSKIDEIITQEEGKFFATLLFGKKLIEKMINDKGSISTDDVFLLYSTYGYPLELTKELANQNGIEVSEEEFAQKFKAHQNLSRAGAEQKFKGGLANTNEQTVKLHTAHHLLLAALQEVLGKEVKQKGSNITEERLRIDFSFSRKLTPNELAQVEEIVNKHIESKHAVIKREIPRIEAESIGAEMEFGAKYPDIVSVYFVEDVKGNIISKEFCGGPHAANTSELGKFAILKEEAVSAGVRRIKAVLRTE